MRSRLGSLKVGHETTGGAGDNLDKFPTVITPLIEDLLGYVVDERHCRVFPLCHRTRVTWSAGNVQGLQCVKWVNVRLVYGFLHF